MNFYLENGTNNIVISEKELNLGDNYKLLKAGSTDAATEKHVPVVDVDGDKYVVTVGSVPHPMTEEHWITQIILVTENGYMTRTLDPSEEPKAVFHTTDKPVAAYEYCNLHGLWVKEL